jgi:hypothetical protein
MKRILFAILISFLMINTLKAECEYSRLIELNTYASHVNYTYDYNESSRIFNVTLSNVVNELNVSYDDISYSKSDGKVIMKGLEEGKFMKILITSNDSTCPDEKLRILYITLPYQNPYYNSEECKDYTNLTVCNSKLLNYKLTYSNFKNILEKYNKTDNGNENSDNNKPEVPTENIFDIIYSTAKKYWIEISLVLGSGLITFFIGNLVYKSVKYKL